MVIKLLEVRDRGTCIPVCAIQPAPLDEAERWLLARAGYGRTAQSQQEYCLLFPLDCGYGVTYDAFAWRGGRTLHEAHLYIQDHFDSLRSGDVVDVEFILGESDTPKPSEREEE